uniref:hAT-like transposase RNase-H fold domain-containing protein n=1 Tax=Chenopodium quinoa TaxID=63459 RepID=A0A803M8M7_CHEQI
MYDMLNNWEQSEDLNFQAMAIAMKKKFDKYWGDVDKMNKFIYVALLLDPHSKMVIVELTLTDMHGPEKGTKLANDVKEFVQGSEYEDGADDVNYSAHFATDTLFPTFDEAVNWANAVALEDPGQE